MRISLVIILLLLSGCTTYSDRIRDVGGRAFEEAEAGSTLVLDGAVRYICETARTGPIARKFNTDELRTARRTICTSVAEPAE